MKFMGGRKKGKTGDVVSLVEAAYSTEGTERDWLDGMVLAAEGALAGGLGTIAYTYDASSLPMEVLTVANRGAPFRPEDVAAAVASADRNYVQNTWRTTPFAAASETPGYSEQPAVKNFFMPLGIRDVLAVNGVDTSGLGVWLGAPRAEIVRVSPAERATWTRIASHLAAALRLRRRAKTADVAILTPSGAVEHAEGDAKLGKARRALTEATKRIARARGRMRVTDPDGAMDLWRGLVEGRWSLVDRFESDGRRFVVAVENQPVAAGPDVLSPRERQILAAAALGRTNKLIAYELGLSHSTIRVLLARAAEKLGVETRRELVALFLAHSTSQRRAPR